MERVWARNGYYYSACDRASLITHRASWWQWSIRAAVHVSSLYERTQSIADSSSTDTHILSNTTTMVIAHEALLLLCLRSKWYPVMEPSYTVAVRRPQSGGGSCLLHEKGFGRWSQLKGSSLLVDYYLPNTNTSCTLLGLASDISWQWGKGTTSTGMQVPELVSKARPEMKQKGLVMTLV